MRARTEFALLAVLLAAAAFYLVALTTGGITAVGFERFTQAQSGFSSTKNSGLSIGLSPVRLGARGALRADFEVEARFGAVALTVRPPLVLATPLQAATVYVEGRRSGSVLFVPEVPGWYGYEADGSPLGGPRCGTPSLTRIFTGDPNCPTYDVTYRITWRLAGRDDHGSGLARLAVPAPHGKLAVLRIP